MKNRAEIKILKNKAIIKFEGKDFLGEVGIDGRIFKALTYARISVGVISQQAAENGISVLVTDSDSEKAVNCLIDEFENERKSGKVRQIYSINNVSVLSFVVKDFNKIMTELARNNVFPLILNQNSAENKVSLVVTSSQGEKAKNILEAEIFSRPKTVHLAIFGHGKVGATLINQVLERSKDIRNRKKLDLRIFAIADSKKVAFNTEGFSESWQQEISHAEEKPDVEKLVTFAQRHHLENLVAVDVTASATLAKNYVFLAENSFDLVSSNKIFNTLPISDYRDLRNVLRKKNKKYLYETNVGAGLPLIDTIKLLHLSGENITRIKGVFSGSLSYIFNNFSVREEKFSVILKEAISKGFTEPDPREDLSGNDVAQKLLILARELDLANELSDIKIENLVPKNLRKVSVSEFSENLPELDGIFENLKKNQVDGPVEDSKQEEILKLFNLNLVGSVQMMSAVLPKMREQKSGKIINISSIGSEMGLPFRGFYSASKSALDKVTEAIRYEVSLWHIQVCALHLGDIKTKIAENRVKSNVSEPYQKTFGKVYGLMNSHVDDGTEPQEVAEYIEKLLTKKTWKAHFYFGKFGQKIGVPLKWLLPQNFYENLMRKYNKID